MTAEDIVQPKGTRFDLGIVGGGQLARMTAEAAARLGRSVRVLDPSPRCPASRFADDVIVAAWDDAAGIERLVRSSAVTTFDVEHADVDALARLEDAGAAIHPSPRVLAVIQDKLAQRRFLADHGIPVPRFWAPTAGSSARPALPVVQKARRGGYDGRGVAVLRSRADLDAMLPGETYFEECVDVDRELAVLVARGRDGAVAVYPTVEMTVRRDAYVLDALRFPAAIPDAIERESRRIAEACAHALDGVGIFAVELFVDRAGRVLVNEIAPRPHNSGHVTIEAAATSQFEQHVRAVLGLPLGSTAVVSPAATVNLIAGRGGRGRPRIEGLDRALRVPGARIHLYGKSEARPGRKMGHVTVLHPDGDEALRRAREIRDVVRIVGEEEAA